MILRRTNRGEAAPKTETEQAVDRIKRMEDAFNRVSEAWNRDAQAVRSDAAIMGLIAQLTDYYSSGEWLHDYQLDEAGMIPRDLRRGVLSQDGLYDLIQSLGDAGVLGQSG